MNKEERTLQENRIKKYDELDKELSVLKGTIDQTGRFTFRIDERLYDSFRFPNSFPTLYSSIYDTIKSLIEKLKENMEAV